MVLPSCRSQLRGLLPAADLSPDTLGDTEVPGKCGDWPGPFIWP